MNKSILSKSNPRTPVNQNKYSQNFHSNFQPSSSGQLKLQSQENNVKYSNIDSQIAQGQDGLHQMGLNSDNNNNNKNEIFYPHKQLTNLYGIPLDITGTYIEDISKNKQTIASTTVNSQNISEILPQKGFALSMATQNNQQSLSKNPSQISLQGGGKQCLQNSQKGSQENLLTTKRLQSIVSAKSSKVGSAINISNYTSEQIQKSTSINMNIPQFQLQPNQEQNKLFSELIGQQQQQYLQQDNPAKENQNVQTFNFILQQNDHENYLKRHAPISIDLPNHQVPLTGKGIVDSQDCSPLLKNNKYSSKSLLSFQKNSKENAAASKTPVRKGTNTSKVSLNATPSSISTVSHDNQKKNAKSNQKSTLKIIQDSSSFNSFLQQQKQQNCIVQQEQNINNKYGSFCSQNSGQQKQNIAAYYTNQKINSSQQINPMTSISIQSSNSINQIQQFQQNLSDQANISELYDKQFLQSHFSSTNYNPIQQGKMNENHMQNIEYAEPNKQPIGLSIQQVTQFTSTCDSSQNSNRYRTKNLQNKPNILVEQNSIPQNSFNYIRNKQSQEMSSLQKPSITQDEDYSVPQELQNSFQMNKNMSKLQNLTTIRASDIDLLKTTEKLNLSQQKFLKPNRDSFQSNQTKGEIEKIQLNIIQNNLNLNINTPQNMPKSESVAKLNISQIQQKPQIYKGKENKREGINNMLSPPTPSQLNISVHNNHHHIPPFNVNGNGNETQRQFNNNRQSIDSFLDVTTKNIPQAFISQEKQSKLSMQHKNKSHRRNCNCDSDDNLMDSCSRVYEWLGTQRDIPALNSTFMLSLDSSDFDYKILQQIQKDVQRTYQNYEFFWNPQILSAIQHILYKYTKSNPEVGYVQGMNLIVGYLIWHADENCAYELLVKICKILNLNDLLKPGFPDLQKHLKTIEVVMILNCPQIYQILNKYDLHPSMFISEWILVLLMDIIPLEYSFFVIDGIIKNGWIFIYRVVINLMKVLLSILENLDDQSEILYVLKSVRTRQKEYNINWHSLLTKQEPQISQEFVENIQNHIKVNSIQ